MITANPVRNVVDLAANAVAKAADLVQLEFRLARTELAEKLDAWKAGLGLILAGVMFAAAALFLLLEAAAAALIDAGLAAWAAALGVAIASLIVAGILFGLGRHRLGTETLKPDRTLDQISRDKTLVKEKLS
jgi:hypothetical protein